MITKSILFYSIFTTIFLIWHYKIYKEKNNLLFFIKTTLSIILPFFLYYSIWNYL